MTPSASLYSLPAAGDLRVLVSDLYLGAYLLNKGARLLELRFDHHGRATLVFKGPDVLFHRKAYAAGEVCVRIPELKSAYHFLRDTIALYQRQHNHPKEKTYAYTRSEDPTLRGEMR